MKDKWTLDELIDEAKEQAIFYDTDYHKEVYENLVKLKKIPKGCKGCCYWSVINNKCISDEQRKKGSLKKGLCE